ncbi:uncharacterized protein LOC143266633 [Megachile rotundata]|uniref:uncharacterized protein LOC143266633 n=1 Tax=Megachile rotundata TaxID=143995 RepID=UPI003FD1C4FB
MTHLEKVVQNFQKQNVSEMSYNYKKCQTSHFDPLGSSSVKNVYPHKHQFFSAEAYAVHDTLNHIRYTSKSQNHAIYTDSMSVVRAIANTAKINKNVIIRNSLTLYSELVSSKQTAHIIWIPSHQGINGNTQANSSAKEATTMQSDLQPTPIPHQEFIHHYKVKIQEEWNSIWNSHPTKIHRIVSNFFEDIPQKHLTRKERIVLARLRTGHCRLTHECLIKKIDPPMCCGTLLTVDHFLYSCQKYRTQRLKLNSTTALASEKHTRNTIVFLKETVVIPEAKEIFEVDIDFYKNRTLLDF